MVDSHGIKALGAGEFERLRRWAFAAAGLHLGPAKQALVAGRLARRLAECGLRDYGAYCQRLRRDAAERETALDLLTTHETSFFREPRHFECLAKEVVPALGAAAPRVWSAACSSGEEPYSVAMTLAEALGSLRFEVFASDLSQRVLDVARKATYPIAAAARIPSPLRLRHCLRGVGATDGLFAIDEALRERVQFGRINLNGPWPPMGLFDAIFLRNVMIYFEPDTKRALVARLVQQLRPGGWLFIGHAESLHGVTDALQPVRPSVYRKSARLP